MKYQVEKSEHDSRLHILNQLLSDIEKEQDMRNIAGSYEELTHFRQRTRNKRKGHCNHAPKCIGEGNSDERDPFGCCNCGTRRKELEDLANLPSVP
jgi:hypothetical protein